MADLMGLNTMPWAQMSGLGGGMSGLGSGMGGGFEELLPQLMSLLNGSSSSSYTPSQSTQPSKEEQIALEKKIAKLEETTDTTDKKIKEETDKLEEKEKDKKTANGGEYGVGDTLESIGKAGAGFITDLVMTKDAKGESHWSWGQALTSGVLAGVAIGASFLCPPIGVGLAIAGAGMSVYQFGKGASDIHKAQTYADKEAAVQEIAGGVIGATLSALGFKGANLLKGAKAVKSAESLTTVTEGLKTVTQTAEIAAKNETMLAVLKNEGLADNTKLAELVSNAIKKGESIDFPDLLKAGITDADKQVTVLGKFNETKNTNIVETTKSIASLTKFLIENPELSTSINGNADVTAALTNAVKDASKHNVGLLEAALGKAGVKDAEIGLKRLNSTLSP